VSARAHTGPSTTLRNHTSNDAAPVISDHINPADFPESIGAAEKGYAMAPLVSIVIPTFNRRDKVLRALESVANQSYPHLEAIVVDDASTDDTVEALEARQFPIPVQIVRLEKNSGPSEARNRGIARAMGKYIALLDSDDHWLPEKIAVQVATAERSANPAAVLVYTQVTIRRRSETVVRPQRAIGAGENIADYLFLNGGYLAQSAVLVSAELARTIDFPPHLRLHEDWDWYIRLHRQGVDFIMVPSALCLVDDRETDGRASTAQPALSLSVAAAWKPIISHKAYLAFGAKIAPQLRPVAPVRALRLILSAYGEGAINTWMLLSVVGRLVHPDLREWAYRIRAIPRRLQAVLPPSRGRAVR
jgi:glycosyltransferase involved in cell wall biosynthesis